MARLLGLWFWLVTAGMLAVFLANVFDYLHALSEQRGDWSGWISVLGSPRIIGMLAALAMMSILLRPVWRWFWQLPLMGPFLSNRVFQDLNGNWEVTIQSNWPAITALMVAAREEGGCYDPIAHPDAIPEMGTSTFSATIEQDWEKASITVHPSSETPLRRSRTFAFDLIKSCAENPQRVFWGFRQTNDEVTATDEDNFLGAALLEVHSADHLEGAYWNNRSWRKGINAAGRITLRRNRG